MAQQGHQVPTFLSPLPNGLILRHNRRPGVSLLGTDDPGVGDMPSPELTLGPGLALLWSYGCGHCALPGPRSGAAPSLQTMRHEKHGFLRRPRGHLERGEWSEQGKATGPESWADSPGGWVGAGFRSGAKT